MIYDIAVVGAGPAAATFARCILRGNPAAALLLMDAIRELAGDKFSFVHWGDDPRYAIDKLLGTDAYRTGRMSARALIDASKEHVEAFIRNTMKYHLY